MLEDGAASLPSGAIDRVRSIAGNEVCMDCGSEEPDWGDVMHGSLICIQCAGRHRALGVGMCFCRSLTMDNWTEANLLSMLLGGNKQLGLFFKRQRIENSSIEALYASRPAAYYREQLSKQVDQLLEKRRAGRDGTRPATAPVPDQKSQEQQEPDDDEKGEANPERDRPDVRKKSRTTVVDVDVEIEDAQLGASLVRALPPPGWLAPGSLAMVTKVSARGAANAVGVRVGDYVVAMNGRPLAEYDEFVRQFPVAPRPARLTLRRFVVVSSSDEETSTVAPEPTVRRIDFGSDDAPLGFSIERELGFLGRARVSKVAPGGRAARLGVRIDDRVVSLNDRDTPTYDVVVGTLPVLPKPLVVGLVGGDDDGDTVGGTVSSSSTGRADHFRGGPRHSRARTAPSKETAGRQLRSRGERGGSSLNGAIAGLVAVAGPRPDVGLAEKAPAGKTAGSFGSAYRPALVIPDPADSDSPRLGTKKLLSPDLADAKEFDVDFDVGTIGMRLEERLGLVPVSVVTHVEPKSQAANAGVKTGCTVQGINGERFLSHAHTTATLRHAKRPIRVRLRHAD